MFGVCLSLSKSPLPDGVGREYRDLQQPEWTKGRIAGKGGNGAGGATESAEEELDRKLKGMF